MAKKHTTKSPKQTKVSKLDDEELELDDVEDTDDDGPDDDDEGSIDVDAGPPPRKPKLTKTQIAFILLNWIMVPTFLVVAYLDHMVRAQYAYYALLNYVHVYGLPLEEEEAFPSLANVSREHLRLTPDQLKQVFTKDRRGKLKGGEEFAAVEEAVPLRLRPSDLKGTLAMPNPPLLADIFADKSMGESVPTLDAEIERLQKAVPHAITNASKDLQANLKTDDEKRDFIRKVLHSMAWDVWQVKSLEDRLTQDKDLDKLADESAQRRMYYDILAPINVYRPADLNADKKKVQTEKIANLDMPINEVRDYFIKRLKNAVADTNDPEMHIGENYKLERQGKDRDSIEKRHTIAFILFSIGQVKVPTLDKKLFPKGVERAQVVSGLHEFTDAAIRYVQTLVILEERIRHAIDADRNGPIANIGGKLTRIDTGFIGEYEHQVDRIVKLKSYIDNARNRLDELTAQRDHFQKIHDQRQVQHKETLAKLLEARKKTEEKAAELRHLQADLHKALIELSDAAERNFGLEARIRAIEEDLIEKATPRQKTKGAPR